MVLLGDECPDASQAAVTCISQVTEKVSESLALGACGPTQQPQRLHALGCAGDTGENQKQSWRSWCPASKMRGGNQKDEDLDIRCAAVDALRRVALGWREGVALHGDPVTVSETLRRLEHRDGAVRACALRTLSWVATIGDAEVISKAKVCLDDGVSNVRAAALTTLAELVVASVVSCLGDCEALVRGAALESLLKAAWGGSWDGGVVAQEGDLVAVPAILELLEHQDGRVRLAAVEALGQLAPKNDASVISAVTDLMEDRHAGVLGRLGAGDDACLRAIRARRDDGVARESVRAAAAFVLDEW
eukprot:Skav209637  [mRNA]  locus=scaffold2751:116609:122171:+ [translate_table: standard]